MVLFEFLNQSDLDFGVHHPWVSSQSITYKQTSGNLIILIYKMYIIIFITEGCCKDKLIMFCGLGSAKIRYTCPSNVSIKNVFVCKRKPEKQRLKQVRRFFFPATKKIQSRMIPLGVSSLAVLRRGCGSYSYRHRRRLHFKASFLFFFIN